MAAANESQGLKIAVAIFVMLTVILAVATYFSYSAYSQADAKLTASESKAQKAISGEAAANERVASISKDYVGARSDDIDAIKTEVKNEHKKIDDEVKSMIDQVNDAVSKAQASGASGPELEDAKAKVTQIAAAYRSEPNKTYISALARLTDLMKNLALLSTRLSLNYVDVKRNLESANDVNAQKISEHEKAVTTTKKDLTDEHDKHEQERQSLVSRLDKFQSENAAQAAKIANLEAKQREQEDDFTKRLALAQQTIREYRDRVERTENVLDRPDGLVTFVDYNRGEVQTNITRSMGARPQMQLSIFDAKSPGIPTDKPKGTIELIEVGDRNSIARIVKTNNRIDPIREGDIVYSAAWSPNEPMRFALIGPIDINRDGRDDREDLKRMIQQAGGIVDYDLPPPEAGKESGKLTGRDAWYVVDDPKVRPPFRQVYGNQGVTALESQEFLKRQTEAVREARLNGVRPMPIERLLPFLGYDYRAPKVGRAEGLDSATLKRVLMPRQRTDAPIKPADGAPAAEPAAEPKPEAAAPKEETPKEEAPK